MRVRLHIERVVIEGVPIGARDAALVQRALEHELARSLAADPPPRNRLVDGAVSDLSAPPLRLRNASSPGRLGRAIGRSISSAMRRGKPA